MSNPTELAAPVHARIDSDFARHLELTQQIIRQPSISADGLGIPEMAAILAERLRGLGATAEVVPTAGFPVVHGELDQGAPRTLFVYGMYDTMPVAGESWMCDPFAAEIHDLPGIGPSTASKILRSRAQRPFTRVDELQTRGLVTPRVFADLRDLVRVR